MPRCPLLQQQEVEWHIPSRPPTGHDGTSNPTGRACQAAPPRCSNKKRLTGRTPPLEQVRRGGAHHPSDP
eukprot:13857916-Alexandrium_andersonii.AAC.1